MTSTTRSRIKNGAIWTAAVIAVIGWVSTATLGATVRTVDTRYVHVDSFRDYREFLALKAQRDSLNLLSEIKELHSMVARVDSTANDIRACQHHKERCE